MEFDKSRVYTALNADELKVGSKVVVADNITALKEKVSNDECSILSSIQSEKTQYRFRVSVPEKNKPMDCCFAYLVSEPEEKKLKWQDVAVGDVLYSKSEPKIQYLVTAKSFNVNANSHIYAYDSWILDTVLENEYAKVGDMNDNTTLL